MRRENEEGQSIILVALAMGIFLIGAVGLGVDGSHIYAQRNLAQNAADSAAIAGIMSIFDATTGATGTGFATSGTLTCSTTDTRTPCAYAIKNGFGTSNDTVTIDFPTSVAGVALSTSGIYPTTAIRVNVARNVPTTLMRLLGATLTTVKATATAAIVNVVSPIPIIVVHPTKASSAGFSAFTVQGTPLIKICGGPQRSIQVDSSDSSAFSMGGSAQVDLSKGGPADTAGNCSTGTGTDLGNWGGPTSVTTSPGSPCPNGAVCIGSTGHYLQPASWVKDPLANVAAPSTPATAGQQLTVAAGSYGCPLGTAGGCVLWTPGSYTSNIDGKGQYNLFAPGLYYVNQSTKDVAFGCSAICTMGMATGFTDNSTTLTFTTTGGYSTVTVCCGTNTTWDGTTTNGGILVYNAGAGAFNVGANGSASLVGTTGSSAYKGILFFENRAAGADASKTKNPTLNKFTPHQLGGGGALSLVGTIYLTNTRATMLGSPDQFQELDLSGNSGNSTTIQGEIIVDSLQLGGGGTITMNLNASVLFVVDQVALVN